MLHKRHSFFLALLDRVSMRHPQTAQPDRPLKATPVSLYRSVIGTRAKKLTFLKPSNGKEYVSVLISIY